MQEKASRIAQIYRGSVKRVLSTAELFAIGYGDVGSSIYYALGITAFFALGATPIALLLAGFVFMCTALSYAELSSMYPESGGSASFSRHAFNDLISFIAGWALLLDYLVTIAISAFAISPYLAVFFPALEKVDVHLTTTVAIIVILFFLNLFGVRKSTKTSVVMTTGAIVTQLLIIVIGSFTLLNLPELFHHLRLNQGESWSATTTEFFKGVAMAMVAYTGVESIAQLGAEAKHPKKNLPRAFVFVIIALLTLYIGLSVVAFSVLSPEAIGTTYRNNPLAGIAEALPFAGPFLHKWVGLFAGILLFVASDAGLLGASRLSYNMGEYYQLPRFFFKLHGKFRTPYTTLAFFSLLSIALVLVSRGKLDFLADLYNFGVMIAFFFTNLSLVVLRIKEPKTARPFRAPLNIPWKKGVSLPIPALIGIASTFAVWLLVVVTKPHARFLGAFWMIAGTFAFWLYRKRVGIKAIGSLQIQKVEIDAQHEKPPTHILIAFQKPSDAEAMAFAADLALQYKATLTAVYIMEVSPTLPPDALLAKRTAVGNSLLDIAEAIAREHGVSADLEIVRARDFATTLIELAEEKKVDLIVMGWPGPDRVPPILHSFTIVEKIVHDTPCRLLIRYHKSKK